MTISMAGERGAAVRHVQRASGQVAALASMIATGRAFAEVTQQLLAARGSLDSLLVRLVEIELQEFVPAGAREEVDDLLRTALGRNAPLRRAGRLRQHPMTAPSHPQLEERTTP